MEVDLAKLAETTRIEASVVQHEKESLRRG